MALGGASSDMGALAVKYQLWADKPDIILVDFAANDYHPEKIENDTTSFVDGIQQLAQAVAGQRNCTTRLPMLMYIDEFFSWPKNTMVQHLNMQSGLLQLAGYHDFTVINYAHVFRDYVYADLHDTTFKGVWSPPDLHGGRSFHITVTWMIAYSLLQMAFDHCVVMRDVI